MVIFIFFQFPRNRRFEKNPLFFGNVFGIAGLKLYTFKKLPFQAPPGEKFHNFLKDNLVENVF